MHFSQMFCGVSHLLKIFFLYDNDLSISHCTDSFIWLSCMVVSDAQVKAEQVIMSHSPLRMFRQFLDKHVLISGQGPVENIAAVLGFTNVTTMDKFRQCFPLLDTVDHKRRKAAVF